MSNCPLGWPCLVFGSPMEAPDAGERPRPKRRSLEALALQLSSADLKTCEAIRDILQNVSSFSPDDLRALLSVIEYLKDPPSEEHGKFVLTFAREAPRFREEELDPLLRWLLNRPRRRVTAKGGGAEARSHHVPQPGGGLPSRCGRLSEVGRRYTA
jgi:hypothetical protein